MIVTPVDHGFEDVLGVSTSPRSPGLHMSEIYGDLYQDMEPTRYVRGAPMDPLRLEAGLIFEQMLEEGLKRRLQASGGGRPGEFVESEHGIIYSPDLILFNGETRLGEIKLTWLSNSEMPREVANNLPQKFDKYLTQMKAYCRCLETPYARLMALFVNGGYEFLRKNKAERKPPAPAFGAWDLTFTKRELDENWSMLINHAKFKGML